MAPCNNLLTKEERKRNSPGPMLIYTHTEEDLGMEKLCFTYSTKYAYMLCVHMDTLYCIQGTFGWHVNMRSCVSGPCVAPEYFPSLKSNHAAVCKKTRDEIHIDRSRLVKGLCSCVQLDVYFPGFPTLKHIPHTVSRHVIYTVNVQHLKIFCVMQSHTT
jgi:5'-3' exoribonuclease 1